MTNKNANKISHHYSNRQILCCTFQERQVCHMHRIIFHISDHYVTQRYYWKTSKNFVEARKAMIQWMDATPTCLLY